METCDSIEAVGRGSEEYYSDECDICKQDGVRKKAEVYCPDCDESLCNNCNDWHKKSKASKHHKAQPVSEGRPLRRKSQLKVVTLPTLCSCNLRSEVSDFCKDHQELICSVCSPIKHRKCTTSTIDQMSRNESMVQTFTNLCEKIDSLVNKALGLKSEQEGCRKALLQTETNCKDEIRSFKTDVIHWLDNLEKLALEELQKKVEVQTSDLDDDENSTANAAQMLAVDKELVEITKKSDDRRQMFITILQIEKSIPHYETILNEVAQKLCVPYIQFERNKKLVNMLQEPEQLGEIILQPRERTVENEKDIFLDLQYIESVSLNVKQLNTKAEPIISGAAFLQNEELLIADSNNRKLTLLNSTLKIKESVECTAKPWDITVVNDHEVIVTLPAEKMLQYYTVSPKLKAGRSIKLEGSARCWGIAVSHDRIYVSRYHGGTPDILVLDTAGKLLNSFTAAQTGIDFKGSHFLVLNISENKLYLSDFHSNQLICMTIDGKHIFTYSDRDLRHLRGLVVDDEDNVLVCGESSNNIHMVKSDGTKHKILLTTNEGIQKPLGMAYKRSTKTLVVGGWAIEELKIFHFKESK